MRVRKKNNAKLDNGRKRSEIRLGRGSGRRIRSKKRRLISKMEVKEIRQPQRARN